MTQKLITYSFYILFFFTPLFFTSLNSELFEFNKMILVYLLTIIITATWIFKMVQQKGLLIRRTPLDIPLALFLLSQILSTIFSIDPHTSFWGYYSRSNGGLFSTLSYILLFYALVSNFNLEQGLKLLKIALLGGLAVSLYAIPEHFGVSPSCIILQHSFSADCWVQDVQSRVFATLGQPNWLGAYLGMLIFPALYFVLTAKSKLQITYYLLLTTCYYLAFTFTYSRGATLGFLAGLGVFLSFWGAQKLQILHFLSSSRKRGSTSILNLVENDKIIIGLIAIFLIINLIFGSSLTRFQLSSLFSHQTTNSQLPATTSVGTQLENGGTESGQIRLIVWKGAVEIFKHYPIFGSGVETFAYSYYNFRPVEHNLVSEWDFLYNKAHNEYLNYLATTGILGFGSYLLLIGTFLVYCIKYLVYGKNQKNLHTTYYILHTSILASYTSYLVQNFFGFSVVIIALFFFTFPALVFLTEPEAKFWGGPLWLNQLLKNNLYTRLVYVPTALVALFCLYTTVQHWRADTFYKVGQDYAETNPDRAFNAFSDAVSLNNDEPLYHVELGSVAATASLERMDTEATLSAGLKNKALEETQTALNISPKNTSIWRTAILTYYTLSLEDPSFEPKTIEAFDQTINLAPTDPKLYYNKALILEQQNKETEAINSLQQAIKLKPNYDDALFNLAEEYQKQNQIENSKQTYTQILKYFPGEPRALNKLQQLATMSAKNK